ncbi:MAG: conserved membrane protein of unknown function [Promethearchaeota archaeon]|nr:MAG: conserved membrane protein of unknown function [Candidatus Lokiarchaeota archaeon]
MINILLTFQYPMDSNSERGNLKTRISTPLLIWGGINMTISIYYLFSTSELIKGILLQAFFWGLIDFLLGIIVLFRKKEFVLEKIKKVFLVNTYLDIGYMIVGILLVLLGGSLFLKGNGFGVIIQGGFLFIIDLVHYIHIKKNLI